MVFTASLNGAQGDRDRVENKPTSSLVVFLGKILNRIPPPLWQRQVVGLSSLPVAVAESNERLANRAGARMHDKLKWPTVYFHKRCNQTANIAEVHYQKENYPFIMGFFNAIPCDH